MGADIHIFAEVKKAGKWERQTEKIYPYYSDEKSDAPFDWRSYGMFGFLAGVRNYSNIPVLGELKGLPDDSEYLNQNTNPGHDEAYGYGRIDACTVKQDIEEDYNYHHLTWLTLKELINFDYNQTFEDLRYTKVTGNVSDGRAVAKEGEGQITTFKEFLGNHFFKCIEILKTLGNPEDVRIIFWFDN